MAGHAPLSTNRIVAAAAELIDAKGEAQLTMRRLGAALDVEAMSIYRYFPSRRTLLDAVAESAAGQAAMGGASQPVSGDDWRLFLSELAHRVRRFAVLHPRLFLLIATHPTAAPWLRPPICSFPTADLFAQRLETGHFPPAAAAVAYKQFCAFLLGHLLPEVAAAGGVNTEPAAIFRTAVSDVTSTFDRAAAVGHTHEASGDRRTSGRPPARAVTDESGPAGTDSAGCPHVTALAGLLAADTYAADFDRDLGQVLAELTRLLAR